MVVDVDLLGSRRFNGQIAPRRKPVAVNFSGDAMKQHERVMALKNELARTTSDLQSALMSLSAANLEICRLNSEVSRLKKELDEKESKQARQPKATRKRKDTSSSCSQQN